MTQIRHDHAMKNDVLYSVDDPRFEPFYALFCEALPQSERKSRGDIEALLARSDYRVLIGEEDGTVVTMAIVYAFKTAPVALLEYMATLAARRGIGLGASTFEHAASTVPGRAILLEVDSDREESADRNLRRRRRQFYERLGAQVIEGVHYKMPTLANGDQPPAMDLMIRPVSAMSISRRQVEEWIREIYDRVYDRKIDPTLLHGMTAEMVEYVR